jgi:hypothetical protein
MIYQRHVSNKLAGWHRLSHALLIGNCLPQCRKLRRTRAESEARDYSAVITAGLGRRIVPYLKGENAVSFTRIKTTNVMTAAVMT